MKVSPGLSMPALRRALGMLPPDFDEVWVTRDGRRLRVGDMDESHVRNALRLVLQRRRERMNQAAQEASTSLKALSAKLRYQIENDLDGDWLFMQP